MSAATTEASSQAPNFSSAQNFTPAPNATQRFQALASDKNAAVVPAGTQSVYIETQQPKPSNINKENNPIPNDNSRNARPSDSSRDPGSSNLRNSEVPEPRVEAVPAKSFLESKAQQYETQRLNSPPRSPARVGYFVLEAGARTPSALKEFIDFAGNTGNPNPNVNTIAQGGVNLKRSLVGVDAEGNKFFNPAPLNPLTLPERFIIEPWRENPAKFTAQTLVEAGVGFFGAKAAGKLASRVSPVTADAVAVDSASFKSVVLSEDSSIQAGVAKTKVSTNVGREFVVSTETAGTLRKDFDDKFIGKQEQQFVIEEINSKGGVTKEFSGVGRADLQVSGSPQQASFEGTYAQLINTGRGKANLQRGTVRGVQFEVEPGVTVGGQGTSIGVVERVQSSDAIDLQRYVKDVGVQKKNSLGVTVAEEVARFEQPLNIKVLDTEDVTAGLQTAPVTQVVGRSRTETLVGKEQIGVLSRELKDGSVIFGVDDAGKIFGEVKRFDGVPTKPSSQVLEQLQRTDSPLVQPIDSTLQAQEAVVGLLESQRADSISKIAVASGGVAAVSVPKILPSGNKPLVTDTVEPLVQERPQQQTASIVLPTKTNFVPVLRPEAVTKSDVDFISKLGRFQLTESIAGVKSGGSMRSAQSLVPDTIISPRQIQRAEQVTGQELVQEVRVRSLTEANNIRSPVLLTPFTQLQVPVVPLVPQMPKGGGDDPLFQVVVGRPGNKVFRDLGVGGVDLLSRGRELAKESAAATVRVVPVNAAAQRINTAGFFDEKTFRRGRREGEFVQRREKRISSGGEKREITLEGIKASKKSRSGGLFTSQGFSKAIDLVNSGTPLRKARKQLRGGFF